MSRFSKIILFAAAAVMAAACTTSARIDGTLESAPSSEVVVKLLDVNRFVVLDTVAVDQSGTFSYKFEVKEGQPEFVYLFYKDTKVASLLLEAGDKVAVVTDTLGNCSIEGSPESVKLVQVERAYNEAVMKMAAIADRLAQTEDQKAAAEYSRQLGKEYVDYYRSCVKYVMENSFSLTAIPVFYQNLGDNLPVFSQSTDAIHFKNVADSLETVYPESKYVKSLRKEADRRFGYLQLAERIAAAEPVDFPDIELADRNGEQRKLSEVDSKVVLLYFWSAVVPAQTMFNLDVLKPLYDEFHKKGFEIYAVSLDTDKAAWAQVVKEQKMPWVNVCDARGSASPYVSLYNIGALPGAYILNEGQFVDGEIVDEASLRNLLKKLLK